VSETVRCWSAPFFKVAFLSRINQYFDGKRTDDEILFRADITRRQLREVLHHYEEYVRVQDIMAHKIF
jgi:hypothetical protein